MPDRHADLVVLEVGTGDVEQGPSAAQEEAAATTAIQELRVHYPSAQLAVLGPLPLLGGSAAEQAEVRDGIRDAAATGSATFIDPAKWLAPGTAGQLVDSGALTPTGHSVLGLMLASELAPLLP